MAEETLKITPIQGLDYEGNYETFKNLLQETNRPGIPSLLNWLDSTDFKTAPASSRFHNSFIGGLCLHSMNVLKYAKKVLKEINVDVPEDSLTIAALLHDLCKADFYIIGKAWDKEYKDKTNKWREIETWIVDEKLPIGHGDKSVALAMRHIPLTKDEAAAIRWHMGAWEQGTHNDPMISKPFRLSLDTWPLVKIIILADQMAELYETHNDASTNPQQSLF